MSSNYNVHVHDESDTIQIVLIGRPILSIIDTCNSNLSQCLYREHVKAETILQQHNFLIATLEKYGVCVIDVLNGSNIFTERSTIDPLQLANLVFTRDPMITTAKGIVLGRFRESIRSLEIDMIRDCLTRKHIAISGEITAPGCLEGGDFFPCGRDLSIVAVGMRTNMEGVNQLMTRNLLGTTRIAIVHYVSQGAAADMHFIHLDCYFGIAGFKVALMWEGACDFKVDEYTQFGSLYVKTRTGVNFKRYLEIECSYRVLVVSSESQKKYGCNVLALNSTTVLTQEWDVTMMLQNIGIQTIYVELSEIHKMYGGIRCATQVISRKSVTTSQLSHD